MAWPVREDAGAIAGRDGELTGRRVLIWFLGFFAVLFAVNGAMIYFAICTFSGLDVSDAYRRGRSYDAEITAAAAQNARAWTVDLSHQAAGEGGIELKMTAKDASGQSISGLRVEALFKRPTLAALDRGFPLREVQPGLYRQAVRLPRPGQWILELNAYRGQTRVYRRQDRVTVR